MPWRTNSPAVAVACCYAIQDPLMCYVCNVGYVKALQQEASGHAQPLFYQGCRPASPGASDKVPRTRASDAPRGQHGLAVSQTALAGIKTATLQTAPADGQAVVLPRRAHGLAPGRRGCQEAPPRPQVVDALAAVVAAPAPLDGHRAVLEVVLQEVCQMSVAARRPTGCLSPQEASLQGRPWTLCPAERRGFSPWMYAGSQHKATRQCWKQAQA